MTMDVEERIRNSGLHLEEVVPNASELAETDQHAFAMLRRVGLGASDSSVILGVNLYTKLDELIQQKRSTEVTEEERKVGELENVRKGRDLEPIILNYFAKQFGVEVHKPKPMYRLTDVPCLTVNFDGVFELNDALIPVEAKFVSKYAKKYWRRPLRVTSLQDAIIRMRTIEVQYHTKIEEHIRLCAEDCGIPPYYYTQVQQQLLALNAPFGYLTSLWDAGWESNTFLIPRDLITQHALVTRAEHVWKQIKGQV